MALTSTQHLTGLGVSIPSMGGGDNTWYQVAQWVTGGIVVALVIGLGFGVFLFVKGKFFGGSADSKKNGLVIGGLSLAGAVVMGTTAGAISWSGRDGGALAAMFPDDAAPGQTVTAERQAPLISCDERASVRADNRDNPITMHPTPAEHSNMIDILVHNGVLEQLKEALVEEGNTVDSRSELDANWGDEIRIGAVEWNPANADGGCNAEQREARAGSTIHVDVWFDSGWLNEYYYAAGYVDRELTVGDNPNYGAEESREDESFEEEMGIIEVNADDLNVSVPEPNTDGPGFSDGRLQVEGPGTSTEFEAEYTVGNTADGDSGEVTLTSDLPSTIRAPEQENCTSEGGYGGQLVCTIDNVEAGETVTQTFRLELDGAYSGDGSDIVPSWTIDSVEGE